MVEKKEKQKEISKEKRGKDVKVAEENIIKKGLTKKKLSLLKTQGFYYDSIEDAKAEAVRVAQEKADAIAKEKAKFRENIRNIKSDEINKRKATKFWWLA